MVDSAGNRYGPYDIEVAGSESESLSEDAWFDLFGELTGVKSGGALTFSGLTATLAAIDMRVKGSYLIRTASWSVTSDATVTSSPRRDMLVARRQRTSGTTPGKTFLTLLKGTPAATPVDPSFDAVNDEPLWSWQVPGSGGSVVTNIRDLRYFYGAPIIGKAWRTGPISGANTAEVRATIDLTDGRTSGGVTFDAADNSLTIGRSGHYELAGRCIATGGADYAVSGRIVRVRAGVADKDVAISNEGHKVAGPDEPVNMLDTYVPLQAGDKLYLQQIHSASAGAYPGNGEVAGLYMSARYVGPLTGATPV